MADKAAALAAVTTAAENVRRLEDQVAGAKAQRDRTILTAQQAGATYPELAAASGLTRDRVSQVLQQQRRRNTTT